MRNHTMDHEAAFLHELYESYQRAGFTRRQSMDMLKTYMIGAMEHNATDDDE